MGMSDLLPCPFCGSAPVVTPWHGGGPHKIMIGCENDEGCVVQPSTADDDPGVARARWNNRTEIVHVRTLDSIILDFKVATESLCALRADTRAHSATETAAIRAVREFFVWAKTEESGIAFYPGTADEGLRRFDEALAALDEILERRK